jgi:hypothetical protein
MFKIRGARWALGAMVLFVGGVTLAAGDPVQREKTAIDAMQSGNAMSVRDGVYRQGRDALLVGNGSIKTKLEAWEEGTRQWLSGWMAVLALADLRDDVPYATFEAALTTQLGTLATELTTLTKLSAQLKTQGTEALARLGSVPGPPASSYPGVDTYQSVIDGMSAHETDLSAALTGMSMMADQRMATIQDLDTRSRIAVIARLRAALLAKARYPLEQTIAAVQQVLDAEKVVDPLLVGAARIENDLDRYALNFQIFHLLDTIVVGRQSCATARTTLGGVTGATRYVTAARARLEQLCTAMENHYQSLTTLGVSNADLVAAYIENDRPGLTAVCRNATNPPLECEKLATVAALEAADYADMDDAHLKFVEYGWSDNLDAARRKGTTP